MVLRKCSVYTSNKWLIKVNHLNKTLIRRLRKHQVIHGGCLALGVIHSNPPVPRFYADSSPELNSLRLPEPDYPTQFPQRPHPSQNSRLESNQVWMEHHLIQFRGYDYSNRFDYSAQRCTALPTRYEPPDLIRELKDVTRCTPSPVLLSPLRRRPMAHTSCPKHTSVHGHSQHPCWALTQGIQPIISAHFIIPSNPSSWPLTGVISSAPCLPRNYGDPGSRITPSLQPILQDVWLHGMAYFQRHENRSLIANADKL